MEEEIYPRERAWNEHYTGENRWNPHPDVEDLKVLFILPLFAYKIKIKEFNFFQLRCKK